MVNESLRIDRQSAPEAKDLHGQQKSLERIGHVVIANESSDKAVKPEKVEQPQLKTKRVETLNRDELMKLSATIFVEGNSLRQIFETHLIGERGLRRLIGEYNKGGDLTKELRREIVDREIDFERDPALRDMSTPDPSTTSAVTEENNLSYKQLINKAEEIFPKEETAFYKAKADYEVTRRVQSQQKRKMIDIIFISVVSILSIGVIIIFLTR